MWRPERAQATVAEATLVLPFSLEATESSSAVAKLSTLLTLGNEALNHREATLEKPLFLKKCVGQNNGNQSSGFSIFMSSPKGWYLKTRIQFLKTSVWLIKTTRLVLPKGIIFWGFFTVLYLFFQECIEIFRVQQHMKHFFNLLESQNGFWLTKLVF